mmetsp:Transcript_15089/g.38129  ORF Transcript_15089/g.38129 Transcript_15089/m.38129 type:complete len:362 (-) Transcript_15089:552-1637(-)
MQMGSGEEDKHRTRLCWLSFSSFAYPSMHPLLACHSPTWLSLSLSLPLRPMPPSPHFSSPIQRERGEGEQEGAHRYGTSLSPSHSLLFFFLPLLSPLSSLSLRSDLPPACTLLPPCRQLLHYYASNHSMLGTAFALPSLPSLLCSHPPPFHSYYAGMYCIHLRCHPPPRFSTSPLLRYFVSACPPLAHACALSPFLLLHFLLSSFSCLPLSPFSAPLSPPLSLPLSPQVQREGGEWRSTAHTQVADGAQQSSAFSLFAASALTGRDACFHGLLLLLPFFSHLIDCPASHFVLVHIRTPSHSHLSSYLSPFLLFQVCLRLLPHPAFSFRSHLHLHPHLPPLAQREAEDVQRQRQRGSQPDQA